MGGIAAWKKPKAGKLLPLGKNGKFPAPCSLSPRREHAAPRAREDLGSRRPTRLPGIQGLKGSKGATGPAGGSVAGPQGSVRPPGGYGLLNLGGRVLPG